VFPYLLSTLLLLVAGVGIVACLAYLKGNADANRDLVEKNRVRQAEITRLKGKGEEVQQQLTPEQKAVLNASHKLVDNKSFGWSRFLADLESVLPGGVSASRITVQNIYNDNGRIKADLELAVLSRDYTAVMTMIQSMQNSGLFRAELRGQDLQTNERITFSEYTLRIVYTPTYNYSSTPPSDVAMNDQGGGNDGR
jgi:Tfp pilus assembly protein PilN